MNLLGNHVPSLNWTDGKPLNSDCLRSVNVVYGYYARPNTVLFCKLKQGERLVAP